MAVDMYGFESEAPAWQDKEREVVDRLMDAGWPWVSRLGRVSEFSRYGGGQARCRLRTAVYSAHREAGHVLVVAIGVEYCPPGGQWVPRRVFDVTFEAESPLDLKVYRHVLAAMADVPSRPLNDWDYFEALERDVGDVLEAALEKHPEFAEELLDMFDRMKRRCFLQVACSKALHKQLQARRNAARDALMECTPLYFDVAELVASYL